MSLVFSLIQLMDCFICELEDSYSLKSFGKDEIHSYLTVSAYLKIILKA